MPNRKSASQTVTGRQQFKNMMEVIISCDVSSVLFVVFTKFWMVLVDIKTF